MPFKTPLEQVDDILKPNQTTASVFMALLTEAAKHSTSPSRLTKKH